MFPLRTRVSAESTDTTMTPRAWLALILNFCITASVFSSPENKVLSVSYCDRPLSVVRRRASSGVRQLFYLNIFSSETVGFLPNFTGMIPRCSSTKVVQTVPVGCISRSRSQNRFSKCNFQKSSCLKQHFPELSYLVYSII